MSLIQVSNLTFGYEGSFDNVFENASFSMDTNWRCGFIGRNGRGKTTFLNLLLGKYAYSGTISASVNFEYFPFEVENPDDTPLEIAESIMPDFEMWRLTRELNLLDADHGPDLRDPRGDRGTTPILQYANERRIGANEEVV